MNTSNTTTYKITATRAGTKPAWNVDKLVSGRLHSVARGPNGKILYFKSAEKAQAHADKLAKCEGAAC